MKKSGLVLLLSDSRGVYIPQNFVKDWSKEDAEKFGVDFDDVKTCQNGPDGPEYWEAWDSILNDYSHIDTDGDGWFLYQDGDLWAICHALLTSEERMQWLDDGLDSL